MRSCPETPARPGARRARAGWAGSRLGLAGFWLWFGWIWFAFLRILNGFGLISVDLVWLGLDLV